VSFSLLYVAVRAVLALVVGNRRDQTDKDLELLVLRHQVRILERQVPGRVRYRTSDRALPSRGCCRGSAGQRSS
jgi:hypothetical protein